MTELVEQLGAVFVVFTTLLILYGFRPFVRWSRRKIPGPQPSWLLGNLGALAANEAHLSYLHWAEQYGSIFQVYYGGMVGICVSDTELMKKLIAAYPDRADVSNKTYTDRSGNWWDYSIFQAKKDYHRGLRAAWLPYFNSMSLANYFGDMVDAANKMLQKLEKYSRTGEVLDFFDCAKFSTMEIMGRAAFGVDFDFKDDDKKAKVLVDSVYKVFREFGVPKGFQWYVLSIIFYEVKELVYSVSRLLPTKLQREHTKCRNTMLDICNDLIANTREDIKRANGGDGSNYSQSVKKFGAKPGSFIRMLMDAKISGRDFNEVEMAANAFFFILAGYETTALTLTNTVYFVSQHENVERKIVEEIQEVVGNGELKQEHLGQLKYMDACIKEAMRMHPIASAFIRHVDETKEVGGWPFFRGDLLIFPLWTLHRSEKYWPEPNRFAPERWLPGGESLACKDMGAFTPFGMGVRMCTGMKFAEMEVVTVLAKMYQKFYARLTPGQVPLKMKSFLTTVPEKVDVTVHRRE